MSRRYQDAPPPLAPRTTGEIIAEQQAELRKQWEEEKAEKGKPKPVRIYSGTAYTLSLVVSVVFLAFALLYAITKGGVIIALCSSLVGGVVGFIAGSLNFTDWELSSHQRLDKLQKSIALVGWCILIFGEIVLSFFLDYGESRLYQFILFYPFVAALWSGLLIEILLVYRFHKESNTPPETKL